jgi:hypothetical protein
MPFHLDPPKIFYSYTRRKHQKYALYDIHQINAPISYCYLSKVLLWKRSMWLCKIYSKKEKNIEKNGQVSEIFKTMGTQMPT